MPREALPLARRPQEAHGRRHHAVQHGHQRDARLRQRALQRDDPRQRRGQVAQVLNARKQQPVMLFVQGLAVLAVDKVSHQAAGPREDAKASPQAGRLSCRLAGGVELADATASAAVAGLAIVAESVAGMASEVAVVLATVAELAAGMASEVAVASGIAAVSGDVMGSADAEMDLRSVATEEATEAEITLIKTGVRTTGTRTVTGSTIGRRTTTFMAVDGAAITEGGAAARGGVPWPGAA